MRLLFMAALALGFMSLPAHAQGLSIAIVWDESREWGANWSMHVQTGLALSLDGQAGIELLDPVSYDGADGFGDAVASQDADVIITDFANAGSALEANTSPVLFMNLSPQLPQSCGSNTVHLAGDVALGRLAALYMNGLNAQRTFAFVKENEEGKRNLSDFRRAFTGGLGGAAFANPDQTNFENEIAILRVTRADGAYFDLEGDALYRYLDAFANGRVAGSLNTVTTSKIDYNQLSEDTRNALGNMTLLSAWNPATVDAKELKAAFQSRIGEDPSFAGLMGFEAGDLLVKAMDIQTEGETLFDKVVTLSWQSPRGPVSFDPQGYAIVPVGAYSFTETALSLKGRISVPADHGCKAG